MNDLPVSSFWTTMDRGFPSHRGPRVAHDLFYVRLACGFIEAEPARCRLGSGAGLSHLQVTALCVARVNDIERPDRGWYSISIRDPAWKWDFVIARR
jgi:hypothetical protein